MCFRSVDEDMDELEEELKSLLNDSKPDTVSGLPTVPATNLQPSAESILSSLPDVPQRPLNISTEQLEEELNQLTLTDSGLHLEFCSLSSSVVSLLK